MHLFRKMFFLIISWRYQLQNTSHEIILCQRNGENGKIEKSGSGTDEVYKSEWAYFDTLDSFLRPQVTPRTSVSNLVSFSYHIPLPLYLTICIKVVTKFISNCPCISIISITTLLNEVNKTTISRCSSQFPQVVVIIKHSFWCVYLS